MNNYIIIGFFIVSLIMFGASIWFYTVASKNMDIANQILDDVNQTQEKQMGVAHSIGDVLKKITGSDDIQMFEIKIPINGVSGNRDKNIQDVMEMSTDDFMEWLDKLPNESIPSLHIDLLQNECYEKLALVDKYLKSK